MSSSPSVQPPPRVRVRRVRPGPEPLPLPCRQTAEAAGFDLMADIDDECRLGVGERGLIPTGLAFEIPSGFEAQIRPRSGLALRHGVTVLNSPGTIDADYRGEVQIILINLGQTEAVIRRGDRIAQMVFSRLAAVVLDEVEELPPSSRGAGGFGHTGA